MNNGLNDIEKTAKVADEFILKGLKSLCESYPELSWEKKGNFWSIGRSDIPHEISIVKGDNGLILKTTDWHGHYDDVNEMIWAIYYLLNGEHTTVNLFCNDDLAATWMEMTVEPENEIFNLATMFNPFDPMEWDSGEGYDWREVRTTRQYIGPKKLENKVVTTHIVKPNLLSMNWFNSSENQYGKPPEGMRWIILSPGNCLFPMPNQYRVVRGQSKGEGAHYCYSNNEKSRIWLTLYFRDSAFDSSDEVSDYPLSITKHGGKIFEKYEKWERITWDVEYDNFHTRMLVRIELDRQIDTSLEEDMEMLDRMTQASRLVVPSEEADVSVNFSSD